MQTAMNAMMADNNLTTVNGHTSGVAVNEWSGFPTGTGVVALDAYTKKTTTAFYYCWDASGGIYPRSADPDVANKPGGCPTKSTIR